MIEGTFRGDLKRSSKYSGKQEINLCSLFNFGSRVTKLVHYFGMLYIVTPYGGELNISFLLNPIFIRALK